MYVLSAVISMKGAMAITPLYKAYTSEKNATCNNGPQKEMSHTTPLSSSEEGISLKWRRGILFCHENRDIL
jgi:hypothetical protein